MPGSFEVPEKLPLAAQNGQTFVKLVELMQRLLAPDGCPWDREQDMGTLRRYVLEEACEVIDAIDAGDRSELEEELGDLALQVVFLAELARKEGAFGPDDVVRSICDKLVRRHPHVFADARADDAASVIRNWEALKAAEKPDREGLFGGLASGQPALPLAAAVQRRAAKLGFDWAGASAVLADLQAVARGFAGTPDEQASHEIGDLLAAVVGLARHLDVDPEVALRASTARFRERLEAALASAGRPADQLSPEEWRTLWSDAAGSAST
jgi:tetrapyrrole methylase family protein/MazG family protein/ATP diphosphatase